MPKLPERHLISFTRKGTRLTVEPHRLFNARNTGAIVLKAWIEGVGWRSVPYCEIRALEIMPQRFAPREMPRSEAARI